MSTSPVTISNTKELRELIQELLDTPTETLKKQLERGGSDPEQGFAKDGSRKICVKALWADAINLAENLRCLAYAEIARRETDGAPFELN